MIAQSWRRSALSGVQPDSPLPELVDDASRSDVLLDAAAMGRVHVERDGVSHSHEARFVLIGTMNPEEGELRPQLLDRFGLTVRVEASRVVAERTEVVRPRADLAGGIDDKLLALYDRIRDSSGGLGAAEFTHGRCGGCRLELNPVDVSAIERAASDEVVRCEECGRILVRTHTES